MGPNVSSSLTARRLAVETMADVNTFVVAFAEESDGSGRHLMLQRALSFDAQDAALGQDSYCIVNDLGACVYGGVTAWRLNEGTVVIQLERTAADALGLTLSYAIHLESSDVTPEEVANGLERVFGCSSSLNPPASV